MADLTRTIEIILLGKDQASGQFKDVGAALGNFEDGVRSVTKPMAEAADYLLKMQAAAAALAVGGIALAVNEAGKFQTAFGEISTLMDASESDLLSFRQAILNYASASTGSFEQVNAAVYAAISAGTDYRDSLGLVSQAELLATAGRADLQSTTVLLASTMNAYGAGAEEAARYSDVFFTIVKEGQTTIPELATSLSQVTSLAAAGGVPIETLGAAIATLTAKGMPTAEAMTAIKGALSAIISPSEQAAKAAADLGIEFGASALASKGLDGVLKDVYDTTGGNVEQIAALFGNVRGLTGVLSAFGSDGGEMFLQKLREMENSQEATAIAAEKMAQTYDQQMALIVASIRGALIQAGLPLLEEFGTATNALTSIFSNLRLSIKDGAFDPLFDAFNGLIARMSNYGEQVAAVLPDALESVDWSNLLAGIDNLLGAVGDLFGALFGNVDLTTAEGLGSVIQLIADALGNLANTSAGILSAWEPVVALLGDGIKGFAGMSADAAEAIGKLLGIAQILETFFEKIGFWPTYIGVVAAGFATAGSEINSVLKGITDAIFGAKDEIDGTYWEFGVRYDATTGQVIEDLDAWLEDKTAAENMITVYIDPDRLYGDMAEIGQELDAFGEGGVPVEFRADSDAADWVDPYFAELAKLVPDIDVEVDADTQPATLELEKLSDKELDIQAKLDVERIKADASIAVAEIEGRFALVQNMLEWRAKLDIAEVNANADKVIAIAGTIESAFESSGEIISAAFGAMGDVRWETERNRIFEIIEREIDLRAEQVEMQKKLTDAEIKWMEARTKALDRGDAAITINGDGLQPHLEAFMWEILGAIQTRVTEEGLDMLLGVN